MMRFTSHLLLFAFFLQLLPIPFAWARQKMEMEQALNLVNQFRDGRSLLVFLGALGLKTEIHEIERLFAENGVSLDASLPKIRVVNRHVMAEGVGELGLLRKRGISSHGVNWSYSLALSVRENLENYLNLARAVPAQGEKATSNLFWKIFGISTAAAEGSAPTKKTLAGIAVALGAGVATFFLSGTVPAWAILAVGVVLIEFLEASGSSAHASEPFSDRSYCSAKGWDKIAAASGRDTQEKTRSDLEGICKDPKLLGYLETVVKAAGERVKRGELRPAGDSKARSNLEPSAKNLPGEFNGDDGSVSAPAN